MNVIMPYKVTVRTRAKSEGSIIYCPHCDTPTNVFHFSWRTIMCSHCERLVHKYEWLTISRRLLELD